jgi:predicted glycosyltransferase
VLPRIPGVEIRGFVRDLHKHLAACDIALVQGGLTTCMELAAARRPFLYFPLRHHFEQNVHVRHRLDRYGAGRCMDYERSAPDEIAEAIVEALGRPLASRPVEIDGDVRAARILAGLV